MNILTFLRYEKYFYRVKKRKRHFPYFQKLEFHKMNPGRPIPVSKIT